MPLLLIDLDNTLVDRSAAFRRWAETFCESHASGDDEAVAWLAHADADGYEPRDRLAQSVRERFQLSDAAHAQLLKDLRWGMADFLELDPRVPAALRNARSAGWVTVIVTNGTVEQQERKLRLTGLDEEVDAWVISEGVGVKKPAPEIFRIAARAARVPLEGAWVVGDSARADIAGAHDLSLRSAWLHRGRAWQEQHFAPTLMVDDCASAIVVAVATGSDRSALSRDACVARSPVLSPEGPGHACCPTGPVRWGVGRGHGRSGGSTGRSIRVVPRWSRR